MKTQVATKMKNSLDIIDLAIAQLKASIENLDDTAKEVLSISSLSADTAKLKYNLDILDDLLYRGKSFEIPQTA